MENLIVTCVQDVSPAWLTHVLFGDMGSNTVVDLQVVPHQTITAQAARLYPVYARPTPIAQSLFLKIGGQRIEAGHCCREVFFYNSVAPLMGSNPALITCLYAHYSHENQCSNVLLQDITDTHQAPMTGLPLQFTDFLSAVRALARLHAFWWQHPHLSSLNQDAQSSCPPETYYDTSTSSDITVSPVVNAILAQVQAYFPTFVDLLNDRISSSRRHQILLAIEHYPSLLRERVATQRNLTLVHGDVHPWNFLFPRIKHDTLRLLDWPAWHISSPTIDLAHLIAMVCYQSQRIGVEDRLLHAYHHELQAHSVNYNLNDLYADYRLSLIQTLHWPLFLSATGNIPVSIWWPVLEKAFSAFETWDCIDLLR